MSARKRQGKDTVFCLHSEADKEHSINHSCPRVFEGTVLSVSWAFHDLGRGCGMLLFLLLLGWLAVCCCGAPTWGAAVPIAICCCCCCCIWCCKNCNCPVWKKEGKTFIRVDFVALTRATTKLHFCCVLGWWVKLRAQGAHLPIK